MHEGDNPQLEMDGDEQSQPKSPINPMKDFQTFLKHNGLVNRGNKSTTPVAKSVKSRTHPDRNTIENPSSKRAKWDSNDLLRILKSLKPDEQFEILRKFINEHPFNLQQLRHLHSAIDSKIKLDIVSAAPYEVALYIMSFLSPEDLCRAAQVCRSWRTVCEDNYLWREKCSDEGLLKDQLTMSVIFKERIKRNHQVQEKFVQESNSAVPRSKYKSAYLTHMSILRNWRTRDLDVLEPIARPHRYQPRRGRQQAAQRRASANQEQAQDGSGQQQPDHRSHTNMDDSGRSSTATSPPAQNAKQGNDLNENNDDSSSIERRHIMRLRCHEDFVITCLQYNPKSELIVSGSDDQTLKVWSSESGRCIATLEGHTGGVWSSQLTDDDIVISGATDRTVRIWRARTGELLDVLFGHTSTVRCLAVCDGRVVSGSRDATLRLWEIDSGTCKHVFSGHNAAVRCVEFRDSIIVSGAYDHDVMVWDAETGACIHTLACHNNRIYSLQFDGKIIASGSLDSTICIWDVSSGKLQHLLKGHESLTSKMQLKGNLLVSANADSFCKIWDVKTGQCLRTLGGNDETNKHKSAITSVYFNDRHVVTSSDDGTVKLWDTKTGEYIRNLVKLPTAGARSGVIWRIRASYTKLICAVGSRQETEDTHLLVLDFDN